MGKEYKAETGGLSALITFQKQQQFSKAQESGESLTDFFHPSIAIVIGLPPKNPFAKNKRSKEGSQRKFVRRKFNLVAGFIFIQVRIK